MISGMAHIWVLKFHLAIKTKDDKRTKHGCHFAARKCSQRETPPQTKLSLSLAVFQSQSFKL